LVKKRAALETLERSEMEAQRIEQYLNSSGTLNSPRRSTSSAREPPSSRREGAQEDTASIDSDFPPTHGDASPTPSAAQGGPQYDESPTHRKGSSGNFITNRIFGRISHAVHGLADVDPERSRRDAIGKTKETITQLEQAKAASEQDVKDASAGVLKDLKRFQAEKEGDLKRYMVIPITTNINKTRRDILTWTLDCICAKPNRMGKEE
jgi:hypothetical protein